MVVSIFWIDGSSSGGDHVGHRSIAIRTSPIQLRTFRMLLRYKRRLYHHTLLPQYKKNVGFVIYIYCFIDESDDHCLMADGDNRVRCVKKMAEGRMECGRIILIPHDINKTFIHNGFHRYFVSISLSN